MSREEWAAYRSLLSGLEAARSAEPALSHDEPSVWRQTADCADSEHGLARLHLEVRWRIAGLTILREYAIGEHDPMGVAS